MDTCGTVLYSAWTDVFCDAECIAGGNPGLADGCAAHSDASYGRCAGDRGAAAGNPRAERIARNDNKCGRDRHARNADESAYRSFCTERSDAGTKLFCLGKNKRRKFCFVCDRCGSVSGSNLSGVCRRSATVSIEKSRKT